MILQWFGDFPALGNVASVQFHLLPEDELGEIKQYGDELEGMRPEDELDGGDQR